MVAGIKNLQFDKCVNFNSLFGDKNKYVVHYLVEFEANTVFAEHIRHMGNIINSNRILVGTAEIGL
jgi:hypothetical protein